MSELSNALRDVNPNTASVTQLTGLLHMAADRIDYLEAEVLRMREHAVANSWNNSADRMGGSFDQSELDSRENW